MSGSGQQAVAEVHALLTSPAADDLYDEAVTEREHALQSAALATAGGEPEELVLACLLHDVGHLLVARAHDHRHETVGSRWLARWFGPDVATPVALHVAAKRYLCAVESGYLAGLSPASVTSLAAQGGPMTHSQQHAFATHRHAAAAIRLRRYDDLAKTAGLATPPLDSYDELIATLAYPTLR
jgi:predicted HD phosphohydrolase